MQGLHLSWYFLTFCIAILSQCLVVDIVRKDTCMHTRMHVCVCVGMCTCVRLFTRLLIAVNLICVTLLVSVALSSGCLD